MRLLCDGWPVAPLEVARTRRARRRGLLGRTGVDGVVWFPRTSWIHTVGMGFAIDVAWCRADGTVVRTRTVAPNRLTRPAPGARVVVEAAAGAFARWGVAVGARLEATDAVADGAHGQGPGVDGAAAGARPGDVAMEAEEQ